MNNILYRHRRSFLHDLAAAVKLTIEWRRAERKQYAANISAQPTKTVPIVNPGYWGWIMEATLDYPKTPAGTREAVKSVFNTFDEETQHMLTFGPGDGPHAWADRVRLWQRALKPCLTPQQYSAAILTMLEWAIECRKKEIGTA